MASEQRRASGLNALGLAPCPSCRGVGADCTLCQGGGRVAIDVAVQWAVEHGSRPSIRPPMGDERCEKERADLLEAINVVLARLDPIKQQPPAQELATQALRLRTIVLDWETYGAGRAERNDVAAKLLTLQQAIGRAERGEP